MLAEGRGPGPLGSGAPWKPPTPGKMIKRRQVGKNQRQASSQRSSCLGLEIMQELVWEGWDVQREFTKTLVLKNIHTKLQKLHVRPPVSKFFTTSIPSKIVLSPGTSFSVPVTFRPLQRCEYEDNIEFQGKDGSFRIYLRAVIPCHALELPDSVLLPLCAVQNSSQATFLLKNVSILKTCFEWECSGPFQLQPEQGLLEPSQECHITVVFQPPEALVYQEHAYCWFGEERDRLESFCTVLLQGLGKYPCLELRNLGTGDESQQCDPALHFGSVAVGQCLQKHFEIFNLSPVTASFSFSPLSDFVPLSGPEFSCDVTEGKMGPGESLPATVTYKPTVVDTTSVEYLSLRCRGALSETLLKLTGSCVGPKVSFSCSVVDFGCVEEGEAGIRTVEVVNSSPAEAIYQWDLDCSGHSVFSIQPASGILRPHSHTKLKAVYRPTQPLAHHRRVACLLLHRDPMFLDLIGTCHLKLQRPVVLKPEHLVPYQLHWHCKQDSKHPLSAMQPGHEADSEPQKVLHALEKPSQQRPDSTSGVLKTPMEEYYRSCLGCSLTSSHVSVVPSELLFNHKSSSSLCAPSPSSRSVSITNHTGGKVSLVWTAAPDSPFSVAPSTCDLSPLKSTSFRVTYDPKKLNSLHAAQLECFAYCKTLQGNDHIEDQLPCPPWCVTVRVVGHSLQPGKDRFTPRCSLKPPRVVFPALGVLSYRTVLLQNCGDFPLAFCLDHSSDPALAEVVSIVPSCGLMSPGSHQILILGTTPKEDSPKEGFSIRLQLNASKNTKELRVVSVVEKLRVSLEGNGSLYFQPTAVESRTQRSHHIRNLSHLPLRFQWSIPEPDQELICVEPDAGELHPNESSVQIWSFNPLAEQTYKVRPTLTFWPVQAPGFHKSQLTLKVVGVGCQGFIEADKSLLDIGEILVGSRRPIEVPLVNKSPCSVSFCLSVQQMILDEDPDIFEPVPIALHLGRDKGTIVSHSTMLLQSTVRPHIRAQYLWTISYQTLNATGTLSSPPKALCKVRAAAVFPTLKVVDVCGGGSVEKLSKVHLWKLLSLDSLNQHLLSSPSPAELTHRTPSKHSFRTYPSIFTKTFLDFNFSAAPLNSDPSTFVLMFHNPGPVTVDWVFLFPEDQQIELEYWAETGEFSSTELHQMKIQENQLFSISPRSGTLRPGKQSAVQFSYSNDFAETHRFPVVFKLSHGREMLLNFKGMTVEGDRPYLHFSSKKHVFTSVCIGDFSPPRQMYELHNGGALPLHYEVDSTVLSQLLVDNFHHPLLYCLNPDGVVLPGQTAQLEWIFSPLEAKMYHMDILIHVKDGDSTLVRFEGCGCSSPALVSTNPSNCSGARTSEQRVQRRPFPGQLVFLSEDSVSLGDIPVCSRSSRILFLTNVSHTESVFYKWETSNQQVVKIHPERGSLGPGENALCVLTFTSTDYPTCYQLDIICQIIQEAALTQYLDALQQWEDEKERQQNQFIITDKKLSERQAILIDKESEIAPVRTGAPLRKYKTLPPICASSCDPASTVHTRTTRAERRIQRETTKIWRRPEPPQPALLHLGVTAHSHRLLDYLTHFPDQFNKHYRFLQSSKSRIREAPSKIFLTAGLLSAKHVPERDIATHVLTSLLWSVFDDPAFTQSLMGSTSTPTHRQVQEPPATHCSTSSHPAAQHQSRLSGTMTGQKEQQHTTVDSEGTAGRSGNRPQTQNTLHTDQVPADMIEDVLLNTLQNLMMEAVRGELVLTAHPRTVILPPFSRRVTPEAMAEEEGDLKN